MNPPSGSHELRPEFRAHLEWQIESALRRESRFASPAAGRRPRLRAAVAVLAALFTGGIAVAASGELQDARQRDLLIETARSEESLVRLRVELAEANYQDARRRFEAGTASREAVSEAEMQLRAMKSALLRKQLDIEEIQATASAPRDDLQAPLVGRRDFVRDRLALELQMAQDALAAAEQRAGQAEQRVKVGAAPHAARIQAETELVRALAEMQQVRATLALRERFVNGAMKADEVAQAARREHLTVQDEHLQREIKLARRRVEEMRRLVEIGQATQLDLKRAEVELLEREVELQRVRREIEMLAGARR